MNKITLKPFLMSCSALFSLALTAQYAPPSDGVFRSQNVGTGEFLTTAVGSNSLLPYWLQAKLKTPIGRL